MSQIATTIEQSKRLLAAGIDPKSADMYFGHVDFGGSMQIVELPANPHLDINSTISPAWSLSRLIDLIADTGIPMNYGKMTDSTAVLEHAVNALEYQLRHAHH